MTEPVGIALRATAEVDELIQAANALEEIGRSGADAARSFEELKDSSDVRGMIDSLEKLQSVFRQRAKLDLPKEEIWEMERAARDAAAAIDALKKGQSVDENRMGRLSRQAHRLDIGQQGAEAAAESLRGLAAGSEEIRDFEQRMEDLRDEIQKQMEDSGKLSKQEKKNYEERLKQINNEIEAFHRLKKAKQDSYSIELEQQRDSLQAELKEPGISAERKSALQEMLRQVDAARLIERERLYSLKGLQSRQVRDMIRGAPEQGTMGGIFALGRQLIPGLGGAMIAQQLINFVRSSTAAAGDINIQTAQTRRRIGSAFMSPGQDIGIEGFNQLMADFGISREYAFGTTESLYKALGTRVRRPQLRAYGTLENLLQMSPGALAPLARTQLITGQSFGLGNLQNMLKLAKQQNLGIARLPELIGGFTQAVEQLGQTTFDATQGGAVRLLRGAELIYGLGSGRGTGALGAAQMSRMQAGMPRSPFGQAMTFQAFAGEMGLDLNNLTPGQYLSLINRIEGPRDSKYINTVSRYIRRQASAQGLNAEQAAVYYGQYGQEMFGLNPRMAREFIQNRVMTGAVERDYGKLMDEFKKERGQSTDRGNAKGQAGQDYAFPKPEEYFSKEEQLKLKQNIRDLGFQTFSTAIAGFKAGVVDAYTEFSKNPLGYLGGIGKEAFKSLLPASLSSAMFGRGELNVNVRVDGLPDNATEENYRQIGEGVNSAMESFNKPENQNK